jgi:hypothetical protein
MEARQPSSGRLGAMIHVLYAPQSMVRASRAPYCTSYLYGPYLIVGIAAFERMRDALAKKRDGPHCFKQ